MVRDNLENRCASEPHEWKGVWSFATVLGDIKRKANLPPYCLRKLT
jgi:hypothetical protein